MNDKPIHLPMMVNANGEGPETDPEKVAAVICWECLPAETWPCKYLEES